MSDTPNDQSGDGSEGKQQGRQSQGGQSQGSQPPGGQARGGQPASGQTESGQSQADQSWEQSEDQSGQPPGQSNQPQGQPPRGGAAQTGPSVGDIFSRPSTKGEIQIGVAVFALVGVGIGLGVLLSGSLSDMGVGFATFALLGSLALAPPIAGVLALRQAEELGDEPDNLRYASAGVTAFAGGLVMYIVEFVLALIGLPTVSGASTAGAPELGTILLPIIVIAIGAAVTAAGVVWAVDNLGASGAQAPAGQANPPR